MSGPSLKQETVQTTHKITQSTHLYIDISVFVCLIFLQVIDPNDGSLIRILGITDQQGQKYKRTDFNQPTGIAVSKDRVVVCDFGNKRIKVSHFWDFLLTT